MEARPIPPRRAERGSSWIEALLIASILLLLAAVSYPRWKARRIAASESAAVRALAAAARAVAGALPNPGLDAAREVSGGIFESGGYLFRVSRRVGGEGSSSAPSSGYVLVAWPVEYGRTGNAAFSLDDAGACFETRNARRRYSGLGNAPPVTAAEEASDPARPAPRRRRFGSDEEEWRPLQLADPR